MSCEGCWPTAVLVIRARAVSLRTLTCSTVIDGWSTLPRPALERRLARQADRLQALHELLGEHVVAQRLVVLLRRCLLEARQRVSDLVVVALAAARGERRRRGGGGEQGNGAAVRHRAEGTLRHMAPEPLVDGHGRLIGDLRVSVTDRCNFRCQYCMPAEGLPWLERSDILTFEEIARLVGLLSEMGVRDVRLTGGEPLVRRDFPRLVAMLRELPELDEIALTTNGFLLERDARALVEAGVDRFNVSIDSLQRDRFYEMTRRDALPQVLRGLEALAEFPEAHPIKVNAVAMRGFTEQEVIPFARFARERPFEVRFIEFMPLDADHAWSPDAVLSGDEIRAIVEERWPLVEEPREPHATARVYRFADGPGQASASSTRCPSPSAPTATGSASPPTGACAPACSRCARPTFAARCARARPTARCRTSCARRCGARSSSTGSTSPASSSPSARCRASAAEAVPP